MASPVPRQLTISIYGDEREAVREDGVGIFIGGHGIIVGDTVRVGGRPRTVRELRRFVSDQRASTLIVRTSDLP